MIQENTYTGLDPLRSEHKDGLEFALHIRQGLGNGTDPYVMRDYILWYWKNHIRAHFYQEEQVLLPYINGHYFAEQLKKEHDDLKDLVLAIDKDPDRALFSILASFIEKHIQFEEQHFYKYLESCLTDKQVGAIEEKLQTHPVASGEWRNLFWVKG
jgi:hemerythrin-like domain-containing protein